MSIIKKTRCNGEWTESRFHSFIKSALRSASRRWSPIYTTKKNARVARNTYICSNCRNKVGNKDICVDHKNPVVSVEDGFVDWNVYIQRMFVESDGLTALCKKCHHFKTLVENKQRKVNAKYKVDNSYTKAIITIEHNRNT
jgi:hypothetical protein